MIVNDKTMYKMIIYYNVYIKLLYLHNNYYPSLLSVAIIIIYYTHTHYSMPSMSTSSRSLARVVRSACRRACRRLAQHTGWPVEASVIQRLRTFSQAGSVWWKQLWAILFTAAEERLRAYASLRQLGAAVCITRTLLPPLPSSLYS